MDRPKHPLLPNRVLALHPTERRLLWLNRAIVNTWRRGLQTTGVVCNMESHTTKREDIKMILETNYGKLTEAQMAVLLSSFMPAFVAPTPLGPTPSGSSNHEQRPQDNSSFSGSSNFSVSRDLTVLLHRHSSFPQADIPQLQSDASSSAEIPTSGKSNASGELEL